MARKTFSRNTIYQLKVTLMGSRPSIWRRLQVPASVTLSRLHAILQTVMGWDESHLHQFEVGEMCYGDPDLIQDWEIGDSRRTRLGEVAPDVGSRVLYTYDFGDGWQHDIVVEKTLPAAPGVSYPICLDGKRAGPPEDSGGVGGYRDKLWILRHPDHPDYEDILEWMGDSFDAEAFDVDAVNRSLRPPRRAGAASRARAASGSRSGTASRSRLRAASRSRPRIAPH